MADNKIDAHVEVAWSTGLEGLSGRAASHDGLCLVAPETALANTFLAPLLDAESSRYGTLSEISANCSAREVPTVTGENCPFGRMVDMDRLELIHV